MRVSTLVLIVAFFALFWVYHNFEPRAETPATPPTAVVPPGFVPDPNYTWVPRTNVRRPKEPVETTTTTSPTETTTTTSPPADTDTPTTTVVDPDGFGPQPPTTQTIETPATVSPTTTTGPTPPTTTTPDG